MDYKEIAEKVYKRQHCAYEAFEKTLPEKERGKPLMLYCNCSKCSPQSM